MLPPHSLHHLFHEIQAEANPARLAVAHCLHAIERIEDMGQIARRDSETFILDANLNFRRRGRLHPQAHRQPTICAAVFHRVANQVFDAFGNDGGIRNCGKNAFRDVRFESESRVAKHGFRSRQTPVDDRREMNGFTLKLGAIESAGGELQNLIDQALEPAALIGNQPSVLGKLLRDYPRSRRLNSQPLS